MFSVQPESDAPDDDAGVTTVALAPDGALVALVRRTRRGPAPAPEQRAQRRIHTRRRQHRQRRTGEHDPLLGPLRQVEEGRRAVFAGQGACGRFCFLRGRCARGGCMAGGDAESQTASGGSCALRAWAAGSCGTRVQTASSPARVAGQ